MDTVSIQSMAACSTDDRIGEILGITVSALDVSVIPVTLRRRSSLPIRLAISAAFNACKTAGVDASETPSLFASIGGEMMITDQLCRELAKPVVHISPTQFHNSVHNAAAAYWSIITGCQQASSAMAAGEQTIAMALVEAWSQLACQGGNLLLVCYEECWPDHVEPGFGQHAIAYAMLLSAQTDQQTIGQYSRPRLSEQPASIDSELTKLIKMDPLLALTPLFQAVGLTGDHHAVPVSLHSQHWAVNVMTNERSTIFNES
ncbi:MAG: beta-ketoacyl synthase chain length factor [Methylococcales bacterium]